jgi:DNA helicase-2/ATP-dependent DNA helicase PcrA
LPHARSIEDPEEIEEERRLCFVGMTRAKEELYLSRAQFREFGGQHKYTIESDFIRELPNEVERIDNTSGFGGHSALNYYRGGGGPAASAGWDDTGLTHKPRKPVVDERGFYVGALVEHNEYGLGKVKELSGFGANRMIRVLFTTGLKTFNMNHVKLTVINED